MSSTGKIVVEVLAGNYAGETSADRRLFARRFDDLEDATHYFGRTVSVQQTKANRGHVTHSGAIPGSYLVRLYSTRTARSNEVDVMIQQERVFPKR